MNQPRLTRTGTTPAPLTPTRYLVRGTIAPRFVEANALAAADAIAFVPADELEARELARMIADGSMRRSGTDRLYLDMVAYAAVVEARRRRLLPWLVIVPVLLAGIAVLFYRG